MITVGLVLAALAVGYFLLTGRFTSDNTKKVQTQVSQASPTPTPTVTPVLDVSPTTPPAMAAARKNKTTLPKTGYPQALLAVISIGVMVSGLGLRRFPH